jgi:hypothetical protein
VPGEERREGLGHSARVLHVEEVRRARELEGLDLEFLYRVLVNDYGWDEDKIYVLNYDGSIDYSGWPHPVGNWPGDGT